jgi:hypothetical protein
MPLLVMKKLIGPVGLAAVADGIEVGAAQAAINSAAPEARPRVDSLNTVETERNEATAVSLLEGIGLLGGPTDGHQHQPPLTHLARPPRRQIC